MSEQIGKKGGHRYVTESWAGPDVPAQSTRQVAERRMQHLLDSRFPSVEAGR